MSFQILILTYYLDTIDIWYTEPKTQQKLPVGLLRTGIAWESDKKYKFKNPAVGPGQTLQKGKVVLKNHQNKLKVFVLSLEYRMLGIFLPNADALTSDVKVLNTSANVSVTNEFGTDGNLVKNEPNGRRRHRLNIN
jgi:hypothetical protein